MLILVAVCVVDAWHGTPLPFCVYPYYFQRGLRQVARTYTRSCLRPLHWRHIDCRLWMSWLGGSDGMMWSIVQSLSSRSLLQIAHTGSRMVLAYVLAFTHSFDECHSAILCPIFDCFGDAVYCFDSYGYGCFFSVVLCLYVAEFFFVSFKVSQYGFAFVFLAGSESVSVWSTSHEPR